MSLGLKLVWRAQSQIFLRRGSSLVRLLNTLPPRQFSLPANTTISSGKEAQPTVEIPKPSESGIDLQTRRDHPPDPTPQPYPSLSSMRNAFLNHEKRIRRPYNRSFVLVKQTFAYSKRRRAAQKARRKHIISIRKQALHASARLRSGEQEPSWLWTLDLMTRHTPRHHGDMLDFKVEIGPEVAKQARTKLFESDTSIRHIERRHKCRIWVQSGSRENEPLILVLSGTNISVGETILDLVQVSGKVSAVKVPNSEFVNAMARVAPGNNKTTERSIGLTISGSVEDQTVTVQGRDETRRRKPWERKYRLTVSANSIPKPSSWTKEAFEEYVGKLVFGRVPTHLHTSLYPSGPDHQITVANILQELFCSEELSGFVTVTALKMALRYCGTKGTTLRPATRAIFNRAVDIRLPLDAEVFQTFLVNASRAGDLRGFNSALRAMVRRGHYIRAENWTAFLAMIHSKGARRRIMSKMQSRGLTRLKPVSAEMARYISFEEIEVLIGAGEKIDMKSFVRAKDELYDPSWLDVETLNRIIYMLGASDNLAACGDLLDLVDSDRRVLPDDYTLNTMITHTPSIPAQISLLSRWPGLEPDAVTYKQLFQVAWKRRLPNMLRVLWRYSAFSNMSTSKAWQKFGKVLWQTGKSSKKMEFIKSFEDVIFGRRELAAGRSQPDGVRVKWLMEKYTSDAAGRKPLVGLGNKLLEAYHLDLMIHKLLKEGTAISGSMRDNLTVDIPLGEVKHRDATSSSQSDKSSSPSPPSTTAETPLVIKVPL
ncbi:hypothetical protein F5Y16DRAFT_356246 [Xylariaceae sp. FL0255]|nr:hypothetical protein F5Y16DRAFT_356246 [Xylariaceae sp. FL0255]